MAIKTRTNIILNLSTVGLLVVLSLAACDQSGRSPKVDQVNENSQDETFTETTSVENDTFSLEKLEERLLPLQTQILQLETQLEESQNSSVSKLEKMENKQWNVTKLKETISALQEDKQDLQAQLKEQLSELKILRDTVTKLEVDCK